eukprot:3128388-Alexandrium_andersonii.AAC.1
MECIRCGGKAPRLHNGACTECAEASVACGRSDVSVRAVQSPDSSLARCSMAKLNLDLEGVLELALNLDFSRFACVLANFDRSRISPSSDYCCSQFVIYQL